MLERYSPQDTLFLGEWKALLHLFRAVFYARQLVYGVYIGFCKLPFVIYLPLYF